MDPESELGENATTHLGIQVDLRFGFTEGGEWELLSMYTFPVARSIAMADHIPLLGEWRKKDGGIISFACSQEGLDGSVSWVQCFRKVYQRERVFVQLFGRERRQKMVQKIVENFFDTMVSLV